MGAKRPATTKSTAKRSALKKSTPGKNTLKKHTPRKAPSRPVNYETFLKLETGTHSALITQLLATPDGKALISAGESTIRIWDVETKEQVRMILGQIGDRTGDGTEGSGNIKRIALSHDGKWIVALTLWLVKGSDFGQFDMSSHVQVYELATGNLQRGFRYPGLLLNLDFSPDDKYLVMTANPQQPDARRGVVEIYRTRDILQGGFDKVPVPIGSQTIYEIERDVLMPINARFIPAARHPSADYQLVVATWSPNEAKKSEHISKLMWYSFSPAHGLKLSVSHETEVVINPESLAVSHEFVVVTAYISVERHPRDRSFFCYDQKGKPVSTVVTASRPEALAFSRDGSRLIVGLANDSPLPGDKIVQVKVFDTAHGQFQLRSTYYGHDDSVVAVAFLQDGTAVSSGGDQYAIHFWRPAHHEAEQIGVIKGAGRVAHAVGIDPAEQIGFGTLPYRMTADRGSRQMIFDLRSMNLRALSQNDPDDFGFATPKWMLWSTEQIITLKYVGDLENLEALEESARPLEQQVELATPDLNLFVGADDEWVIWSKSGYYNASQHGDRRFGYHVNRGADKEALYFPGDRFKVFYRPDIIQAVIEHGSEDRARAAGVAIPRIDVSKILPPIVELGKNGVSVTLEQVAFTFTARTLDRNNPVKRVWIVQNDQFAWTAPELKPRYMVTLPLRPGRNAFKILAENEVATSTPLMQIAQGPASPTARVQEKTIPGNLYLVSVGVSEFDPASIEAAAANGYKPLNFADEDAIAIYNAFAKSKKSDRLDKRSPLRNKAFQSVKATILLNQDATRAAILSQIARISTAIKRRHEKNGTQRDVLFVFLSGHGVQTTPGEPKLYFWNYDLNPTDLKTTGLSLIELGQIITSVPADVILAIDACHSGMAGGVIMRGLDPDELAKRIYAVNERGMYILNASRSEELAYENKAVSHGFFTQAILAALQFETSILAEQPGSTLRSISMLSLIAAVQQLVPYYTGQKQTSVCRMYGDLLPLDIYKK